MNDINEIAISTLASFSRVLIAIIIVLPLSISMGFAATKSKMLSNISGLAAPVPKLALMPIIMLFLGIGEAAKIILCILVVIFPMSLSIRDGFLEIDNQIYEPFIAAGFSKRKVFWRISLILCFPKILSSLKNGISSVISCLFFAESFGTSHGLGYYIIDMWIKMNYPKMLLGIVFISLLGFLFLKIIYIIEKKIIPRV